MREAGARVDDTVEFFFSDGTRLRGIVKHVPNATGDSWIIWTQDRDIYHIGTFYDMCVINRKGG